MPITRFGDDWGWVGTLRWGRTDGEEPLMAGSRSGAELGPSPCAPRCRRCSPQLQCVPVSKWRGRNALQVLGLLSQGATLTLDLRTIWGQ